MVCMWAPEPWKANGKTGPTSSRLFHSYEVVYFVSAKPLLPKLCLLPRCHNHERYLSFECRSFSDIQMSQRDVPPEAGKQQ